MPCRRCFPLRNIPTTNSGFLLDTTSAVPQNPPNFSRGAFVLRTSAEKFWRRPCNIFPAGPCSASMRNVWPAEHGCARTRCIRSCVRIVARRCIACRHPWGLGCGFVPARLARIVRSVRGRDGAQFAQISPGLGSKDGSRFSPWASFAFRVKGVDRRALGSQIKRAAGGGPAALRSLRGT